MRRIICLLPALLLLTMVSLPSYGQESQPEVRLENAQQEARARELFRNLRCEVCEGRPLPTPMQVWRRICAVPCAAKWRKGKVTPKLWNISPVATGAIF